MRAFLVGLAVLACASSSQGEAEAPDADEGPSAGDVFGAIATGANAQSDQYRRQREEREARERAEREEETEERLDRLERERDR